MTVLMADAFHLFGVEPRSGKVVDDLRGLFENRQLSDIAHGFLCVAADGHGGRGLCQQMFLGQHYLSESGMEFFFAFTPLGTWPTDSWRISCSTFYMIAA